MNPVSIVGDSRTVLAFALGGVPGRAAGTAAQTRAALEAAVAEARTAAPGARAALLLVTRGAANFVREELDLLTLDPTAPLIVEIPGFGEPAGESRVERFVERVLGVRL